MGSLVPRTALPGKSRSIHDEIAKGLGYFSIGLGLAEIVAPGAICRAAGIAGQEGVVRAYGAREIATGVAIVASHDPTPWIWGRVSGDALDIATVATTPSNGRDREDRRWWTIGGLIAVTALDAFTAKCLSAEKGGPRTARADYHDRSGFPKGIQRHAAQRGKTGATCRHQCCVRKNEKPGRPGPPNRLIPLSRIPVWIPGALARFCPDRNDDNARRF